MPKESKPAPVPVHRKLPYPTVSSSINNMAPFTITASTSPAPNQPTSPPPSAGGERQSSASWPKEKDDLLIRARKQGLNWQPIASKYFPDKSPNACRKRHERLMEKRNNADDWDGAKMEALAKAYNDVREQMWRLLADKIGGEKWHIVESKCMEKGLKTLQATGRTAARRDRQDNALHSGAPTSEYDDYADPLTHRSPTHSFSRSHPTSDDGFNDSALGPDAIEIHPLITNDLAHHSLRTSPQHHPRPFAAYPTPSRGHSPPYPPPSRTFSNASSSAISTTDFTPTLPTAPAPKFPSQILHAGFGGSNNMPSAAIERQRQNSTGQTLPSFSDAFGMPSITGVSRMPLTSMS